ncbi:hypothetical protein GBAR_LOCUS22588 [Geodia barretti]|uniref:Uncharacterized protein n=1 Tax=Geodia barretti TaxID=519541 RepID=A0AA35T3M0_GEOBA|nr:hypothetical protein GBAR_LOCUS22588 [Geodia barretti]
MSSWETPGRSARTLAIAAGDLCFGQARRLPGERVGYGARQLRLGDPWPLNQRLGYRVSDLCLGEARRLLCERIGDCARHLGFGDSGLICKRPGYRVSYLRPVTPG